MHCLLLYQYTAHFCYCIEGWWCFFPMPLLIFIYYMMGLIICEYEDFWPEVSEELLRLGWLFRPVGLFLENFSWYKAGKLYENNKYLYAIMLKGRWSAVMDDAACGAHQERRMKMERTPPMDDTADGNTTRIHWLMKLRCLVSCVFPT